MQTTGSAFIQSLSTVSILKSANEQPRLAGELISETVANMHSRVAQNPPQPVDISALTGTGTIINTTA